MIAKSISVHCHSFFLNLTTCATHMHRVQVNDYRLRCLSLLFLDLRLSIYNDFNEQIYTMYITFPSLCMCLLLGPKRPKYNHFLSKNISYNISNQRRRQNVSSSVRNFTGSCPNSRDQGRIMLHYLEGYPSNLRKLIIFKKSNNSDYFHYMIHKHASLCLQEIKQTN